LIFLQIKWVQDSFYRNQPEKPMQQSSANQCTRKKIAQLCYGFPVYEKLDGYEYPAFNNSSFLFDVQNVQKAILHPCFYMMD